MGTVIITPILQLTTVRPWEVVYAAQGQTESAWPSPSPSTLT